VGLAKKTVGLVLQRATERRAFGRSIGEFSSVKDVVASMLAQTFAIESMTALTAARLDRGEIEGLHESTACKVVASEALSWMADQALQLAGGLGYLESAPYAPLYRDARAFRIVGGTNETLRSFLVLSAGLSAEPVSSSRPPSSSPWWSLGQLGERALQRARSVLGGGRLEQVHPLLRRDFELFALLEAEVAQRWALLVHQQGRELPELQVVQRVFADRVLDLYALGACLARTHRSLDRRGEQGSRRELELTWVFGSLVRRRARQAFAELEEDDQALRRAVAARAYADRAYPFEGP
jgi:acyl-CoA dehydrogenase family protein 9